MFGKTQPPRNVRGDNATISRISDGSVRFISDFIETGTNGTPPGCLGVWDKLNLSNDRQPLDPSKY